MQLLSSLEEISDRYNAVFCDLWGVVHNGVAAFPAALAALERYRQAGGKVVLLTNSPRPSSDVKRQLEALGVAAHLYDAIAASGDATRMALASGSAGRKIFHLGPERDRGVFAPAQSPELAGETAGIEDLSLVPFDEAEAILCSGLFDDTTETPDDYRAMLLTAKIRSLPMLCANPDIVVDRGGERIYCAGAIAEAYAAMGGEVRHFGKPHPQIYDLARRRLTRLMGRVIPDREILCIGDGVLTDLRGAALEDLDALFITGGLAAANTHTPEGPHGQPDPAMLRAYTATHQISPPYAMGYLR